MGTKSVLTVIIIGAAGTAAGLPYYNGMQAEKHLDSAFDRYTTPGALTFTKGDYQRRWLDADASSSVTLSIPNDPLTLELKHQIKHGPSLAGMDAYTITTTPVIPEKISAEIAHYFGDATPLLITTRVHLDGREENEITSPAFTGSALKKPEVAIEWQGVSGTLNHNKEKDHGVAKMTAPGLKVSDSKAEMVVGPITLSADMTRQREKVWTGDSQMAMESIAFKFSDPAKPNFRLDNLRIASNQSAETEQLHTVNVTIEADQITVDDYKLTNPGYAVEIKHLDIDAWTELNEKLTEIQATSSDPRIAGQMAGIAFVSSLPAILKSGPEFTITRLGAETPDGTVNSMLRLAYTGNGQLQLDAPVAMLMDLEGEFEFEIPQTLMRKAISESSKKRILAMAAAKKLEYSNEELETMATQAVETQLNLFLQQKWLLAEGESYQTKITYNKGQLTINGESANQLFSMMMQPQPQQ